MRATLETAEYVSKEKKTELLDKINEAIANTPEGSCGSPEVILAVHIMRDVYLEAVKELMSLSPSS